MGANDGNFGPFAAWPLAVAEIDETLARLDYSKGADSPLSNHNWAAKQIHHARTLGEGNSTRETEFPRQHVKMKRADRYSV